MRQEANSMIPLSLSLQLYLAEGLGRLSGRRCIEEEAEHIISDSKKFVCSSMIKLGMAQSFALRE